MTPIPLDEVDRLQRSALEMGLALPPTAAQTLLRYLDLLQQWNAVYNLTAVRDRAAMRTQHLLDCLAVVEPFRRMTASECRDRPKRILDVGSGGGLPGVILATLLPDWSVVCVDTVGKKSAFVQQVASELAVSNLSAMQSRVEALREAPVGVVTARAFSSLSRLVETARHQLAPSGLYMAMKGKVPASEIDELARSTAGAEVFHVEQLTVPGLDAERCIVWMQADCALNCA